MSRLNTFVHVHREGGLPVVFGPDDVLPDWAVKAITNPTVWADEPTAESVSVVEPDESNADESDGDQDVVADDDSDGTDDSEPTAEPVKVKRRPGRPRKAQ